jgi:hypothetical protein
LQGLRAAGAGWRWPALAGALVLGACTAAMTAASAQTSVPIVNDLGSILALGQGLGQSVATTPLITSTAPMAAESPPACGAASHPDPDPVDGRLPASLVSAAEKSGFSCNTTLVAHQGDSGGFKTLRYIDPAGHECAYYDTTLLYPLNALHPGALSTGVAVVDMSNPVHPVQTDTLTALPMLSPHESLVLNAKRGLLGADLGNPAANIGDVAFYSVSRDCRHPVLDFSGPIARFGHEGAFSPDGNTFWSAGAGFPEVTAIDVSDPSHPKPMWVGNMYVHGLSFSPDGSTAYMADPVLHRLYTVDVTEIQNRVPNPKVSMISQLAWTGGTIPQNAYAFTSHGHPYVFEFDEFTGASAFNTSDPNAVGAARIIDDTDPAHPSVVSNIRLQIDQEAAHAAANGDPGTYNPVQGYAAHYCSIPSPVDPAIVACSFIASGLRVFDIADPLHPKEIAYYMEPPRPSAENGFMTSDFTLNQPVIVPERREIWFTDGVSGLYVVRVSPSVWPAAASPNLTMFQASRSRPVAGRYDRIHVLITVDHGAGPVPVAGATVTIDHRTIVTDSDGDGTIVVKFGKAGGYRLVASLAGYNSSTATIKVARR